jgi:hypothetical protein
MWSNSHTLTSVNKSLGKLGNVTKLNVPRNNKENKLFPCTDPYSGQEWEMQLFEVGKVERVAIVAMRLDETAHSLREM